MPEKGDNILKFNKHHKQLPQAFVIYADFEAITEKIHTCQPNDEKSFAEAYQKHTDCGNAYKLVCCYMTINIASHFNYIEVKTLFINLWKVCFMK